MGSYTTFARALSMIGGLGLVGVGAFLNVADLAKSEGFFSPSVVLFYGFAGGVALAAFITPILWRGQRGLACLLCVGVLCCEAFAFYSTAERLMAAREERASRIGDANAPRALAEAAMGRAIADLAAAKAEADKHRSDKKCGVLCAAWEDRETKARFHLTEAEKKITSTASIRDAQPLARSLGFSPTMGDIIPALLAAAGLLITGFMLIAAGHPPPTKPEPLRDDIEVSPPPRRVRKDEAIAKIRDMRERNGGVMPPFAVVQSELKEPSKANAHRWRKLAMGE